MKHVIIGTAGHVDHGKTTLIKALTGTDTDRLKEEQERGMTIDLGFASLRLPDGTIAGIVDVPGHERFLKNMLAGVSGVDVVLLVIAADEGIMPQTVEHLDILRLLHAKNGVVVLTKIDMVDREWTDAVEEDVRSQLAGTFLADVPIIRVSATTGKGIDALKRALQSAVSRAEVRNAGVPFRLPIDRVFTRPGFGTVVTGTLVAGTLHVGDLVEIVPQQAASRVRGLQIHNQKVTEATAGSRVAVNLANVEVENLERGAQLTPPNTLTPTLSFDAVLSLLPDIHAPLQDRDRVRLHIGTAEILGRIRLLDERTELPGGATAYVQFQAEQSLVCARGDRFVVRTYSPLHTIGGGAVLDASPARHRKGTAAVLAALATTEKGSPGDLLETILQRHPYGLARKDLFAASGMTLPDFEQILLTLLQSGQVVPAGAGRLVHKTLFDTLSARVTRLLEAYHGQFPLRGGMPSEELRTTLDKNLDQRTFQSLLAPWQQNGLVVAEAGAIRLAAFQVELNERQNALMERIASVYRDYDIAIPTITDVSRLVKAPPDALLALLRIGTERGLFSRVADGQYYQRATLEKLQKIVRDHIAVHGTISVGELRDLTASNRKFALQALEYLDVINFTRRQGDERVLVDPPCDSDRA
ncbi:MAG: selenocysteine-specific translation elongation factor SelB [Chthonomonadaceae bacterium]|nr:selenocysteine-specific translation elongation factor SelB [Chthonomonadaceae bacterium]